MPAKGLSGLLEARPRGGVRRIGLREDLERQLATPDKPGMYSPKYGEQYYISPFHWGGQLTAEEAAALRAEKQAELDALIDQDKQQLWRYGQSRNTRRFMRDTEDWLRRHDNQVRLETGLMGAASAAGGYGVYRAYKNQKSK